VKRFNLLVIFNEDAWICLKGRTVHGSVAFSVDYCLCHVLSSGDFDRLKVSVYSNGLIDGIDQGESGRIREKYPLIGQCPHGNIHSCQLTAKTISNLKN